MRYISIDGDNIGQAIANFYFMNDAIGLSEFKDRLDFVMRSISESLTSLGFQILFCAADGIAACSNEDNLAEQFLVDAIKDAAHADFTFSAGVGPTLRDSYIALLFAKSAGKDRVCNYKDIS